MKQIKMLFGIIALTNMVHPVKNVVSLIEQSLQVFVRLVEIDEIRTKS